MHKPVLSLRLTNELSYSGLNQLMDLDLSLDQPRNELKVNKEISTTMFHDHSQML